MWGVLLMGGESYTALADFYDALMGDIDYDSWANYLHNLLKNAGREVRRVGEAACGTGNLTLRLKALGYDVIGTDQSEQMLAVAAKKAREAGVSILFSRQDMRGLQLPKVDAVVAACDGVNYLSSGELPEFFAAAAHCLKPGGALLFDMSSRYKLEQKIGNNLFFEDGETLTYFWRNTMDVKKACVDMELTFFRQASDGRYEREDEAQRQYWHEQDAVLRQLEAAGFCAEAYEFGMQQRPGVQCERIQFFAVKK